MSGHHGDREGAGHSENEDVVVDFQGAVDEVRKVFKLGQVILMVQLKFYFPVFSRG